MGAPSAGGFSSEIAAHPFRGGKMTKHGAGHQQAALKAGSCFRRFADISCPPCTVIRRASYGAGSTLTTGLNFGVHLRSQRIEGAAEFSGAHGVAPFSALGGIKRLQEFRPPDHRSR